MGYIRDISIAIILLLRVGAIFTTINIQISFLFGLAASSDVILVRNFDETIDESFIPVEIEND